MGRRESDREREEELDSAHRQRRIAIGLLLAVILAVCVIFALELNQSGDIRQFSTDKAQEAKDADLSARLNQYVVCETFQTTAIRRIRHEFVDLKRRVLIPLFGEVNDVFAQVKATIPPGLASAQILEDGTRKINRKIRYLHRRIRTIDGRVPDPNCFERYPPLPGQHFPTPESLRPNSRPLNK